MNPINAALAADVRRHATAYARTFATVAEPETIATDVAALHTVAALIEDGNLKRAYRAASKLDTIVRDSISPKVWAALEAAS